MTNSDEPLWISEAEAVSLIDLGESIAATYPVFRAQASGAATNLTKTQARIDGATIHAIGGGVSAGGYVGIKSWVHTAKGAVPMVMLWTVEDGSLLAVIEAHALGQYRTAAVSAVATSVLAAPDAATMAILGSGNQALIQVAAVNAVRPLDQVSVWSPRAESRAAMAKRVEDALQIKCAASPDVREAVAGSSVITLVTRAKEPFLAADMPDRGAHINAIGAIGLDRAEFEPDLLGRCATVAVDDRSAAAGASRELQAFYGDQSADAWLTVVSLADVVAAGAGREDSADLTLFKAMGVGIADLALAQFIYEQARENGLGRTLPRPARSNPRLRVSVSGAGVGYV